jgi:putative transposase
MKQNNRRYSLQSLCGLFGYSRQAFYKQQRLQLIEQSRDGLILQQVLNIRKEQSRCGTRKLLVMLQPFFKKQDIQIGRDAFFQLLAKNKLLIRKRKRSTHTTNSKHFFYRYPNLVAHFTPLHAHELSGWPILLTSP